jgi:hypothetical protein
MQRKIEEKGVLKETGIKMLTIGRKEKVRKEGNIRRKTWNERTEEEI